MGLLKLFQHAVGEIDGVPIELGSLLIPTTRTITSLHKQVVAVAVSTAVELFDVADDLSDFDFLWIQTDFDVMLELVTDAAAAIGRQSFTLGLKGSGIAGKYGAAFVLDRDDSYANYTISFGGGTLDTIDRLTVKNLSASQEARVLIVAGT